jgi:hypothetical protein
MKRLRRRKKEVRAGDRREIISHWISTCFFASKCSKLLPRDSTFILKFIHFGL